MNEFPSIFDNLLEHVERELDIAGILEDKAAPEGVKDNTWMRRHILNLTKEFIAADHNQGSAQTTIDILNVLLTLRPLTPLTGKDDEWEDQGIEFSDMLKYKNKRCMRVFKTSDNRCVDVEGKVFWEWIDDGNGEKFKSYYTNKDSWVDITFPYVPFTEYVEKQTEQSKIASMPFTEFKN